MRLVSKETEHSKPELCLVGNYKSVFAKVGGQMISFNSL
jgi:hypothetical protein